MDRELRITNMASRQERMNAERAERAARILGEDPDAPTLAGIATALGDLMTDALHLARRVEGFHQGVDFEGLGVIVWDTFELERAREREDFLRRQELLAGDSSPAAPSEDPEEAR